jgi:hypothetical protein
LSLRASLQTWKRIAVLLAAAAVVLAAPYGVAVAVRASVVSIIIWNAEIGISGNAVDVSASLLRPTVLGDATGPSMPA